MSSSAITTPTFQAKIGSIQNQADTSSIYSAGQWSFKNSTAVTSVTITDAGNVGIGTSSPNTYGKFVVASTGAAQTVLTGVDTGNGFIQYWGATGRLGYIGYGDLSANLYVANDKNAATIFTTNTTERMRIDSSGNVGIGTTGPAGKVYIAGPNTSSLGVAASNMLNLAAAGGALVGRRVNLGFAVVDSAVNNAAAIAFEYTDQSNFGKGDLLFATRSVNTDTAPTERMRINASGNLLVGYTSGGAAVTNGAVKAKAYNCKPGGSGALGANIFNINWVGSPQLWIDDVNVGTITVTSDYRIKKNVETQELPALERIAHLRPVKYEYTDYKELYKADGVQREGFIAHELQAVIPSAVDGEKDAEDQIQSLKLDALCSVMVKAIQELSAKVDAQAAEIDALKAKP